MHHRLHLHSRSSRATHKHLHQQEHRHEADLRQRGWQEGIDVCLNERGTVVGIPAFHHFGQVFTIDVEEKKFEFVNRLIV